MHPAQLDYDIWCLIFKFLEPRQLARFAQTCKAFFDAATDELWRTINSFSPFLYCLPPDFRGRPLRAEDIQRLELYAAKVQNLFLESPRGYRNIRVPEQFRHRMTKKQLKQNPGKSWEEFWEELAKLRPAAELFSNLRRLRINNVVGKLLIPLTGISGSNLVHIHIESIQPGPSGIVVLNILDGIQDTPNLAYLSVRYRAGDPPPLKLIRQSPLKHLRLDHQRKSRPPPFQYEILQKSTLEKLALSLRQDWNSPEIKVGIKYLPALRRLWLDLTAFELSNCDNSSPNMVAHSWLCKSDERKCAAKLGRRSPALFLKGLSNPELTLLNIKFPVQTPGTMLLDVVSAAKSSSRLNNLSELTLAGCGRYHFNGPRRNPEPVIKPVDLRKGLKMLLPMPQLKILRITLAPNFLDVLNLNLYKSIADGLPALEKLWLGHADFCEARTEFQADSFYERTPLHHLAAFCSMLPNLVEVTVGAVDGLTMEKKPRANWACPHVQSLTIQLWAGRDTGRISRDLVKLGLATYFPNTQQANKNFKSWEL